MPRSLTTTTEVVVSAEDDAEARRVTLTNTGRTRPRDRPDLLCRTGAGPPSADLAHPAFSKMFVVTDYLPELGVIIATRRRRSPHDPEVWAAHIAVVEGIETAPVQIETDRARFIGRGRSLRDAGDGRRRRCPAPRAPCWTRSSRSAAASASRAAAWRG